MPGGSLPSSRRRLVSAFTPEPTPMQSYPTNIGVVLRARSTARRAVTPVSRSPHSSIVVSSGPCRFANALQGQQQFGSRPRTRVRVARTMPTRTDHVTLMRGAAAIGAGWQLGDSHHSHADTGASSVGLGLEHRCGVKVNNNLGRVPARACA